MKPGKTDAMRVKHCKTEQQLIFVLQRIYAQGIADATGAVVDETKRFLHVPKGKRFACICPECGEELTLDLEELIEREAKEGDAK